MSSTVQYPVKLARSSSESLAALITHVQNNPEDHTAKAALADELDELGRGHESHFLRNHPEQAMVLNGKVTPYTSVWYSGMHMDGEDYDNYANILDEHGPEAVNRELGGYQDLNDFRHQQSSDTPGWGTSDRSHGPFPVTWTNRHTGEEQKGAFHVYHNPGLGYIGTEYEHYQPVDLPDPSHTEPVEDFRRGSYQDAKHFADAEMGVPHSIVPFGSDWTVNTAPEHHVEMEDVWSGSGEPKRRPKRVSRVKYAAQERQRVSPEIEESALLKAIETNPEDKTLHDAYADHLSDQGRHGEAAMLRHFGQTEAGPGSKGPARKMPHLSEGMRRAYASTGPTKPTYAATSFGPLEPDTAILLSVHQADAEGHRHISGYYTIPTANMIMKALDAQGVGRDMNHSRFEYHYPKDEEEPQQYAAYRAPKGGAVVRGTFYVGGKLLPDLEGDFANPPQQEAPAPTISYPVKKRVSSSLRQRLSQAVQRKPPSSRPV